MASFSHFSIHWGAAAVVLAAMCQNPSVAVSANPVVDAGSIADASASIAKSTPNREMTDIEAEKRALELVNTHLPELNDLLGRLKADNPRQYDVAIRDLAKSARRLENVQNRDERLYEIEVELLKAQSNVKILAAKLKVRDNAADRKLLHQAAARQLNAEIAKAELSVRILRERAERAQQQLTAATERMESLKRDSQDQLEKKYNVLLRHAGRLPPERNKKSAGTRSSDRAKKSAQD